MNIHKKLYCLDVSSGRHDEIDFKEMIPAELKSQIQSFGERIGLSLEIQEITNTENFVRWYFLNKGYEVIKLDPRGHLKRKIKKLEEIQKNVKDVMLCKGVPDFFCFKDKNDWLFVEAKSSQDGLNMNQAVWIVKNKNLPTKVFYVAEESWEDTLEPCEEKIMQDMVDIAQSRGANL